MNEEPPEKINFTTQLRDGEVDVTIDCQKIAREFGRRALRNHNGLVVGVFGAIRVRRVKRSDHND